MTVTGYIQYLAGFEDTFEAHFLRLSEDYQEIAKFAEESLGYIWQRTEVYGFRNSVLSFDLRSWRVEHSLFLKSEIV